MAEAKIIDGKATAAALTERLAALVPGFTEKSGVSPGLAVVLIGEDPASAVYVRNKARMAEKLGYRSIRHILPAETSEGELIALIEQLNAAKDVHGILVQLPLPNHIDEGKIIELIAPEKDVDGFHPINVGRLAAGEISSALLPCTPAGSVRLAKIARGDELSGLDVVVIGRSNIVGKPAFQLFLRENCTVTVAHSRTRDLPALVKRADIVVAATGKAEMVRADWLKPGATVIDVGINRLPGDGAPGSKARLVGDVDFADAKAVAGAITPVPGGVGPMTIAMLMANTLTAAHRQSGLTDPLF